MRGVRQLPQRHHGCRRAHGRQAHMTYKLLGKNFVPPDVLAKVTGQAKYAEDFRVDGMVFCRFLPSPYPHARIKNLDAKEALKMEGVLGILTADEVTPQ